jgi:hypothetical protein
MSGVHGATNQLAESLATTALKRVSRLSRHFPLENGQDISNQYASQVVTAGRVLVIGGMVMDVVATSNRQLATGTSVPGRVRPLTRINNVS